MNKNPKKVNLPNHPKYKQENKIKTKKKKFFCGKRKK